MRTVTLSGWGQPPDALSHLAPGSVAVDYMRAAGAAEAMRMIAGATQDAERVIGWSLGGQLAVRAVAEGAIAPKQLVLIGVPYQFVGEGAQGREIFAKFYANYKNHPRRTLEKAWELVHYEDVQAERIRAHLSGFDKEAVLAKDWLRWLGILEHFDCDSLDFSGFPATLLVHGNNDKVVGVEQSVRMASRIRGARLVRWDGCGHAPHWHDAERLKKCILSEVPAKPKDLHE